MTTRTAGLSLKEAFAEAEAEDSGTADETSPVSDDVLEEQSPQEEQPAVESDAEDGLFKGLRTENASEQPEGDSQVIEVDGQQYSVSDVRQGVMMQADYTQKTQELARQRADNENAITLYDAFQQNPGGTIRLLQQRTQNAGSPLATNPNTNFGGGMESVVEQSDQQNLAEIIRTEVANALAADTRLQAFEDDSALSQINALFAGIEEDENVQLSDADKQYVLEEAQRLGTTDLRFVFGGLQHKQAQLKARVDNAQAVSAVRGRGSSSSEQDETEMDETDLRSIWTALEAEQAGTQRQVSNL